MLSAVSHLALDTYGYDLDNSHLEYLENIENFECLYTNPNAIPRNHFQIVSMTHSIEHFADPSFDLRLAHECLEVGGHLFIQVNDTTKTPSIFL